MADQWQTLPSIDRNDWYYPSNFAEDEDDSYERAPVGVNGSNWGNKTTRSAQWVRKGKMAAWAPAVEEWEVERRARQRIADLLGQSRSPSPSSLPHLRPVSPPLVAPYPEPTAEKHSYASFILDTAIAHSFQSKLLDDLQATTTSLIEGEAGLRRVLGQLWQVINNEPEAPSPSSQQQQEAETASASSSSKRVVQPKREDAEDVPMVPEDNEVDEREARLLARVQNPLHKIFLTSKPQVPGGGSGVESVENLEKSVSSLKELQDDGREYIERLQEIRELLGDLRAQKALVWKKTREAALGELEQITGMHA